MKRRTKIQTPKAPKAFGPFSQAVKIANLVFTSGQLPLHPDTGEIVKGGIQAETRQVLQNLRAILAAAGSSLDLVIKATVFITDMKDFSKMNEVYAEFFPRQAPPARSCVEVSRLAKGAQVEVEAIALLNPKK